MSEKICVIIGASHAGVNLAFSLRKTGWQGQIKLFDADPALPYHRPPLSKTYLAGADSIVKNTLKSEQSYDKENILLNLGIWVDCIDSEEKIIKLSDGQIQSYDKLVIATGARPIIPPIKGIESIQHLYPLRTAADVSNIREAFVKSEQKRIVIIGGGYIGLETAASLKKLGASSVTVLERESRILARVTAPEMSQFFENLHAEKGVSILTNKNVSLLVNNEETSEVYCEDGSVYPADIVIVGVGIHVNSELAEQAGIEIENGIKVNGQCQTNLKDIYSIGDCSFHHNPHYDRYIRLESVQNAVDQAKITAAALCEKEANYDTLPWFWSDQYDVKLQMVGLSTGYNDVVVRKEIEQDDSHKFSVWYFKDEELLAVDAINNAKAYVMGTKFIKSRLMIDKNKLIDNRIDIKTLSL